MTAAAVFVLLASLVLQIWKNKKKRDYLTARFMGKQVQVSADGVYACVKQVLPSAAGGSFLICKPKDSLADICIYLEDSVLTGRSKTVASERNCIQLYRVQTTDSVLYYPVLPVKFTDGSGKAPKYQGNCDFEKARKIKKSISVAYGLWAFLFVLATFNLSVSPVLVIIIAALSIFFSIRNSQFKGLTKNIGIGIIKNQDIAPVTEAPKSKDNNAYLSNLEVEIKRIEERVLLRQKQQVEVLDSIPDQPDHDLPAEEMKPVNESPVMELVDSDISEIVFRKNEDSVVSELEPKPEPDPPISEEDENGSAESLTQQEENTEQCFVPEKPEKDTEGVTEPVKTSASTRKTEAPSADQKPKPKKKATEKQELPASDAAVLNLISSLGMTAEQPSEKKHPKEVSKKSPGKKKKSRNGMDDAINFAKNH